MFAERPLGEALTRNTAKAAKARNIYKGRKPTINAAELRRLRDEEKLGPAAIARRLGIRRASVYRVLGKPAAPA